MSRFYTTTTTAMNAPLSHILGRQWLASALLAWSIVSFFVERHYGGELANWNHITGGLGMVWYLRFLFKDCRALFTTEFYYIVYAIGMLISSALVSGGAYMIEITEFGNQNGAFWIVVAYFITGYEASRIGFSLAGKFRLGANPYRFSWRFNRLLIIILTTSALGVAASIFIRYGGPLLQGVDRVTFWRTIVPNDFSFVPSLLIQTFFFAAFYFLWIRHARKRSIMAAFLLIAYVLAALFVLGQKFSAFIIYIHTWLVISAALFHDFKIKLLHIIGLTSVVILLSLSIIVSYTLLDHDAIFALVRVALQSQLLWSVLADESKLSLWPQDWICYFSCPPFNSGADYISFLYLPYDMYNFYTDGGSVLSGFMPALSIITFGLIASLLTHILILFILGFIQRKILFSLTAGNMIYGFLLFKLHLGLTMIWFSAMTSAAPGLLTVFVSICIYRLFFIKKNNTLLFRRVEISV